MKPVLNGAQTDLSDMALLAFDYYADYALSSQHGLRLRLSPYSKSGDNEGNTVFGLGKPGARRSRPFP